MYAFVQVEAKFRGVEELRADHRKARQESRERTQTVEKECLADFTAVFIASFFLFFGLNSFIEVALSNQHVH